MFIVNSSAARYRKTYGTTTVTTLPSVPHVEHVAVLRYGWRKHSERLFGYAGHSFPLSLPEQPNTLTPNEP